MLKCDICSGKLVMIASGMAVCDSCGIEYSPSYLREKIMKADEDNTNTGSIPVHNYLIRANQFYDNKEMDKALEYYDRYLDYIPDDQEALDHRNEIIKWKNHCFHEGEILTGKVSRIEEFGCYVEFFPGYEGFVHISKIAKHRINSVTDVVRIGDTLTVVCLGKNNMGKFSFSAKDVENYS